MTTGADVPVVVGPRCALTTMIVGRVAGVRRAVAMMVAAGSVIPKATPRQPARAGKPAMTMIVVVGLRAGGLPRRVMTMIAVRAVAVRRAGLRAAVAAAMTANATGSAVS